MSFDFWVAGGSSPPISLGPCLGSTVIVLKEISLKGFGVSLRLGIGTPLSKALWPELDERMHAHAQKAFSRG